MISDETVKELDNRDIPYILGSRMRRIKEVKEEVLSRAGRYRRFIREDSRGPSR